MRPLREKLDEILGDVKTVTARVNQQTERVDTPSRGRWTGWTRRRNACKHSVRDKVNQATGVVRGIRAVVASVLRVSRNEPPDTRPLRTARSQRRRRRGAFRTRRTSTGEVLAYEYDRLEREDGGGSFLMGLLAGTVLGAGLGMLSRRRLARICATS